MFGKMKAKALAFVVAALVCGVVGAAPKVASAQAAYPMNGYVSHLNARTYAAASGQAAHALDDSGGTTSSDPDYTDTFAGVTTEVTNAISGPGKLAIGVMILGVIFSVVWRLIKKGSRAIG